MGAEDERIRLAVSNTEILRPLRQKLSTFGATNIRYYLLTEPAYSDLVGDVTETVIREGRVIAERPKIVTPYYLSRLEGFSADARRYFESLIKVYGSSVPGLFYAYRNELKGLNIVTDSLPSVVNKINDEINERHDPLSTIIKGVDELWDVSLMKSVYEIISGSLQDNLWQMNERGLLDVDASGIPADARMSIEEIFNQVSRGEREPRELKEELDRWGLFEQYEDRFYTLFKR